MDASLVKIWWVEDFLSGAVLENQHYATHDEALAARERLGFGIVKSADVKGGVCPNASRCRGCD